MSPSSPPRHGDPADRRAETGECLGEDLLLDLIEGRRAVGEPAIAAHLDGCAACRALLAELASGDERPARLPQPGERVGRYTVLSRVGAGAFGVVYAAFDPTLDRKVALKRLHPAVHAGGADGEARFLREAQALARLRHPNVVAIHDVLSVDGQVFLAMDLVEGGTLTTWLAAQPRTWREIAEVFRKAGEGLAAAHRVGLVHRDFKPDNVLVGEDGEVRVSDFGLARLGEEPPAPEGLPRAKDQDIAPSKLALRVGEDGDFGLARLGEEPPAPELPSRAKGQGTAPSDLAPRVDEDGEVRVSDFGLARLGEEPPAPKGTPRTEGHDAAPSDLALTRSGARLGTPAFMSPEQLAGRPADARSDVFSFCVALSLALTGQRPFTGDTPEALAHAIARGPPPAVFPARIPRRLARAITRGLHAEPAARPDSLAPLLAALTPTDRPVRMLGALAAVALLLGAGVGLTARRAPPSPCEDAPAEWGALWSGGERDGVRARFLASGAAGADALFASVDQGLAGYRAAWIAMDAEACRATLVRHEQPAALMGLRMRCLTDRRREAERLVHLFATADRDVVSHAGSAVANLPSVEDCANAAALTSVVPLPASPQARREVANLSDQLAEVDALYLTGQYARGKARAGEAVARARALGYRPLWARLAYAQARLVEPEGPLQASEAALEEASALAEEGHDDGTAADAWTRLGFELGYLDNQPEAAQPWLRLAKAAIERMGGDDVREAERLWVLASLAGRAERWEKGLTLAQKSRALLLRARGPRYWRVASLDEAMGVMLEGERRLDEALAAYRRSRTLRTEVLGPQHPITLVSRLNEAEILRLSGDAAAAIRIEREVLTALGPTSTRSGYAHAELGASLRAAGQLVKALEEDRRAEALETARSGQDGWPRSGPLLGVGLDLLALGRPQEAISPLEEALRLRAHDTPPDAQVPFALARALWDGRGDRARARTLAQASAARLAGPAARWGYDYRTQAEAITAWLEAHPPPAPRRAAAR